MSTTPKDQPSNVSTADTPERPANIFLEEPEIAAAREADEAVPGDKPGQTSDDSAKSPNKSKRKPNRNRPAERRISKLTKQLDDSNSANAELQSRIEELEAKPPAAKPEPKLRDFKTPREYADAIAAWVDESKPAPKPKAKKPDPAKPPTSAQKQHADDLKRFAKDGTDRLGDKFQEAFTDDDLAINQVMGEYLLDSDHGPELMVYLHDHPDEAKQIWFDKEAVARLEKIEDELEPATTTTDTDDDDGKPERDAQGKFAKKPDPKPTTDTKSKAPRAPGESERGEVHHDPDLETADMDSYAETRTKQIEKRGGLM